MKHDICIPATLTVAVVLVCGLFALEAIGEEKMNLQDFILIAHRGVTTDSIQENSLASLEETIRRGYTHMEVDLRSTKDGFAVCLHDESLRRTTGLPHLIHELTLAEVRALVPVEILPDFATFCARAAGRIGLMPDIKPWPPEMEEAFARSIEAPMIKHGLMEDAYFIGRSSLAYRFSERGRISWGASLEDVKAHERAENQPGDDYFIFRHAVHFDQASVEGYQALGLKVIVSINIHHYLRIGHWKETGIRDVERMLAYGVDGLQIDCAYEPAFRKHFFASTERQHQAAP